MRKILLLLAACGAGLAAPVQAQVQGGYFGAGALSAFTDNARDFASASGATGADRSASGFKAFGGFLWQNRFGIEGGYYDLGRYEVTTGGVKSDDFSISAFAVSGVIAAPLGSSLLFTGKLGLAFTTAKFRCFRFCGFNENALDVDLVDTKVTDVSGLLGAGLGWRVSRNFSLRADFEYLGDVTHAVGLLEANFPYRVFSVSGQVNF
jgi:OOP family OmpA-OmpF porin